MKKAGNGHLFRQTWFFILLAIALAIVLPFAIWRCLPSHPLHVWILDKTPENTREHQGVMWSLNHGKIINAETSRPFDYQTDNYGIIRDAASGIHIRNFPQQVDAPSPELIYVADTYGDGSSYSPASGLLAEDMNPILTHISRGSTLIAEFNSLGAPTQPAIRNQMEQALGVDWLGWTGRYYADLSSSAEVPQGVIAAYETNGKRTWDFRGAGLVLISDDNRVIVLEQGKDIVKTPVTFAYNPDYQAEFGAKSTAYFNWFEYGHAAEGTEVLANYHIDATPDGLAKLQDQGLPTDFPAVYRKHTDPYTSYYFAGDYADNEFVPARWGMWGIEWLKAWFTPVAAGETDAFYWQIYIPLMKQILHNITKTATPAASNAIAETGVVTGPPVAIHELNGVKQISMTQNGRLAVYDGTSWQPRFWNGINFGATKPGHYPGELATSKDDYLRWFPQMKQMNVNVVRVYTILPPDFYEALDAFNQNRKDPLLLLQGVWTPEEELIGKEREGNDAYRTDISDTFHSEIVNAVKAIHGDVTLPSGPGHASGTYKTDVSRWLLGWIIGTEWYPYAVKATNDRHPGTRPFAGTYFEAAANASPFESWLAGMLDTAAIQEMKYGWQHPISFTNWLTTDPLRHPNEPLPHEDLVTVDAMHIRPKAEWSAGYFASYHAYPYYPDFLRFQASYQTYRDARGQINPYAGYLHDLRQCHPGIPLLIAEFGVPSSRGIAHYGPAGRNQGMHTEQEQGTMDADMIRSMYDERYDGAILFEWQDEWFKFTWNTIDYEIPEERRAMWHNRLTNEENFGIIAVEPGKSPYDTINIDGKTDDWRHRNAKLHADYDTFDLTVTHDASNVYLLLEKKQGAWDLEHEPVTIGFDTLGGGSHTADVAPGFGFSEAIETLLTLRGEADSRMLVNSAYDQHTWLYGSIKKMLPRPLKPEYLRAENGIFLPWRLALNKPLYLPESRVQMPFEEYEVGVMRKGNSDPSNTEFNTLADWYMDKRILEVRIPWMLLGYTDPSSHLVWDYPFHAGAIVAVPSEGIRIMPYSGSTAPTTVAAPLFYDWSSWNEPVYHERKKRGFDILQRLYGELAQPKP